MICALVLAAGQSRRMGTQKLLLSLAGQTVIGHIVDRVLQSAIQQVFVVVSEDGGIAEALISKRSSLVVNADTQGDMLSSVRAGLRVLPPECEAALVVLGDQPTLQPQTINQLIERHSANSNSIVVPVYEGKRGHPLLLPRRYFAEVLSRYDDVGLRGLLQDYPGDVQELAVFSPDILEDMDVPADYERIRARDF